MKKGFTIKFFISAIIFYNVANPCYADPVNPLLAKTVAKNFYNSKSGKIAADISLVHTERADDNSPVYYVFNVNEKDGFVIVSADDLTEPVLGYSKVEAIV